MEREPLAIRNGGTSAIQKPLSKIPMLRKKRPLNTEMEKENEIEPIAKKPKFSVVPVKPAGTSALTKRPLGTKASSLSARAKSNSTISTKPSVDSVVAGWRGVRPASSRQTSKPGVAAAPSKVTVGKTSVASKRKPLYSQPRRQDREPKPAAVRPSSRGSIEEKVSQLSQRVDHLESVRVEQEVAIQVKEKETSAASQTIRTLEVELSSLKAKYRLECESYEERISTLERKCRSLTADKEDLERNLTTCRSSLSQLTANMATIQGRYDAMKLAKECAMEESACKSATIASLEENVRRHLDTIGEANAHIREDELLRRKLHNTIQEMKGNIRVFCRVRPALQEEVGFLHERRNSLGSVSGHGNGKKKLDTKLHIEFPDGRTDAKRICMKFSGEQTVTGAAANLKSYTFEFDRTFGPESTQGDVFSEISQLVQSSLDGYNVCIFAYGQTGSGKTFTMEGPERPSHRLTIALRPDLQEDQRGMIPRALEQVFQSSVALREQGWKYKLEASFLEIYNEMIRDLLSDSSGSHDIKMDPANPGSVYVTNIKSMVVTSQQEVATLLEQAARNRAVAATQCNERSSRSHSVFRLHITGHNTVTDQTHKSCLNLIDLAGSERLASSGSSGERLKETKNINKSLSNLGQVIMALANKEQHIPYRNSKLTYLLQNSLGGNSKTLMFVNMSPLASCFQESLCSLRFATKVNECNVGVARKSTTK